MRLSDKLKRALDAAKAKKSSQQTVGALAGGRVTRAAAGQALGQVLPGIVSAQQANGNIGQPQQGMREHPETARFRSFAERYMIARAHNFRVGHEKEDQWQCILDAKTAYAMIARTGREINPQIGDDTF